MCEHVAADAIIYFTQKLSQIYARAVACNRGSSVPVFNHNKACFIIVMGDAPRLIRNQWLPLAPILSNRLPSEKPIDGCYLHYHTSCVSAQSIRSLCTGNLLHRASTCHSKNSQFPRLAGSADSFKASFDIFHVKSVKVSRNTCSSDSQVYPLSARCLRFPESLAEPFLNPNRTVRKPCRRFSQPLHRGVPTSTNFLLRRRLPRMLRRSIAGVLG